MINKGDLNKLMDRKGNKKEREQYIALRGSVVRTSVFGWRTFPDREKSVRYRSTNQANSAFHPFGVGK